MARELTGLLGSAPPKREVVLPSTAERRRTERRGSRELLINLTLREIRSQFKRTALGRLWSFINPLAIIAIYSLVFGFLLRQDIPKGTNSGIDLFTVFLASALIPWNFLSGAIMGGMGGIVNNAALLSKVYFPRYIPVVATVLAAASTFLTELGVLLVVVAFVGGPKVFLFIPFMLAMAVLMVIFVTGVALMLSVAMVFFRDTQHFMALFIQIWLYLTPIIYSTNLIISQQNQLAKEGHDIPLRFIWGLNPAYRFTDAFRVMLYDYDIPRWQDWAGAAIWAFAALGVGLLVFRKFSARLVEEL
jgi:ABC-type polysaccharide/polyol phosphate export permease